MAGRSRAAQSPATSTSTSASASREEQIAAKLLDRSFELQHKIKLLQEIRDNLESLPAKETYFAFLAHLLPTLVVLLEGQEDGDDVCPPNFVKESNEHRFRQLLLECVQRIPQLDALKPHVNGMVKMLFHLVREDCEDIAVLACRHAIDLFRQFKEQLQPMSDDFLALIKECYAAMDASVLAVFGPEVDENGNEPKIPPPNPAILPRGLESFKLLSETPVVIVFLFQNFRTLVQRETGPFLPLIFQFLSLEPALQAKAHREAESNGKLIIDLHPALLDKRQHFNDLLIAQVKSMSFVAYVLRMNVPELNTYRDQIGDIIIRLLKDVPVDATANRRELLIAIRHVVASDYKTTFSPYIDIIINEKILIGNGLTAHEGLRTVAYSITTDLVHHVRTELTPAQLSTVVHKHTAHIHDAELPFGIQTMCSKLLINLIGHIMSKERDMAAQLLSRILEAFVRKVESLGAVRGDWQRWSRPARPREEYWDVGLDSKTEVVDESTNPTLPKTGGTAEAEKEPASTETMDTAVSPPATITKTRTSFDDVDIERCRPCGAVYAMAHYSPDPMAEARILYKNLILAIKAILSALKHIHGPMPDAAMMARLFVGGIRCLVMIDGRANAGKEGRSDTKETCEALSELFTQVDLLSFNAMWELKVPYESEQARQDMQQNPEKVGTQVELGRAEIKQMTLLEVFLDEVLHTNSELILVPQILLSHREYSHAFVGILLKFLVTLLPTLSTRDAQSSSVIIRLFKMSFMAVTIYPEANESILLPHLSHIIMQSLKLASESTQPMTYYLLLRALFRSIGGGRFENLYKAVLPLLQTVLETLNALLATNDRVKRDLFVELCLTVPVRLSVLLPYLSYLMKPLVLALESGTDLVAQGLRTLELCVNNLTAEFLSPLMAPVIDDIMTALWKLLKPSPPAHPAYAHQTVRILGKLGGRNRRTTPPKLEWHAALSNPTMIVSFDGKPNAIKMMPIIELACRTLKRGDIHYRAQAFTFLKHAAASMLKPQESPNDSEEALSQIFKGLFESTKADELAAEANDFLTSFTTHIFEHELVRDLPEAGFSRHTLPLVSALLDAVAENISSGDYTDLQRAAQQTQDILQALLDNALVGREKSIPVLRQMAARLGSLCYTQSWASKSGGAAGLQVLTQRLNVPQNWLSTHELEIVRALLFMLKEAPGDHPPNLDMATQTLLHVIRNCHVLASDAPATTDTQSRQTYLVGLLILELCSQSAVVRQIAQQAIKIIADAVNQPVATLLSPVKDRLLTPIFAKPLRALAFSMQIGHIDAITYCITLDPPLLAFDPTVEFAPDPNNPGQGMHASATEAALYRLLVEALGIADAEDVALTGKINQHKSAALLTRLRVACIQLLSAAMSTPEFSLPRQTPTRTKILSVYFKLLYKPQDEVVLASYDALKAAMTEAGKLPKDLLQSGLRPVLMNLADHRKLDVACLEGLARLLELMTNYFKVEIGQKLLDHFRAISGDAQSLTHAALNPHSERTDLGILSAIVNVFRLLPHPAAKTFLTELCQLVVTVEAQLKKSGHTVFTIPLARYLAKYPVDAVDYFFQRFADDPAHLQTFRAILTCEDAEPLREHVAENAAALFENLVNPDSRVKTDENARAVSQLAPLHAGRLLLDLIRYQPASTPLYSKLTSPLVARWCSSFRRQRLHSEGQNHVDQIEEDDVFLEIFIAFMGYHDSVDLVFHAIEVYTYQGPRDQHRLSRYIYHNVIASTDIVLKRKVLLRSIELMDNANIGEPHKACMLRYLINPLLFVSFSRGQMEKDLIDEVFLGRVHERIWLPWLDTNWVKERGWSEMMRVELLTMTTLLLRRLSNAVGEYRKDVIRIAWSSIQFEHDATVSQCGSVLGAQFIKEYECQPKVYLSILQKLLRAHLSEAKPLVREALGIMAVALSIGNNNNPENPPVWLKAVRQQLMEEPHSVSPLSLHVYQFIASHPTLFFARRDLLVAHIVSSLGKLTLSPGPAATTETRSLAMDLMTVILGWEQERLRLSKSEEMDVDKDDSKKAKARSGSVAASSTSATNLANNPSAWQMPPIVRENITTCLMKTIIHMCEGQQKPPSLSKKGLILLRGFLDPELWPDHNVKLSLFQTPLIRQTITDQTALAYVVATEVLHIVVQSRSDDWVATNAANLWRLIEKGFASPEANIHAVLKPIALRVFHALKDIDTPPREEKEGTASDMQTDEAPVQSGDDLVSVSQTIATLIDEGLRSQANLNSTIILLAAYSKDRPERIDAYVQSLIRVLSRLTKEHISGGIADQLASAHRELLETTLGILCQRISFLADQRRWLLSALVQLIEKSPNTKFCQFILKTVDGWVMDRTSAFPTIKEKAGLLVKMMLFDGRGDEELMRNFFDLILRIYKDPQFSRTELTVRLEQAFLLGCRIRDANVRCQFMELFDQSIARGLFTRLHYLIGVQSWEALADTYWLHQAMDLLLGAADRDIGIIPRPDEVSKTSKPEFLDSVYEMRVGGMVDAARQLLYADAATSQIVWVDVFQSAWQCLSRGQQADLTKYFISLLSKEYHLKGVDRRPNNIQALLGGLCACSPQPLLPPQLVRYLGRTYNAYYTSLEILQGALQDYREEANAVQETTLDALAEMYSDLCEDDLYYGLWRRRSYYPETNIALSFEQNGMWLQALQMFEAAQVKARTGVMPFTEAEYAVWEDHWVACAMKLQQWDILSDLARHESNADLLFECTWRLLDWTKDRDQIEQAIQSLPQVATPRRRAFEAFNVLTAPTPPDSTFMKLYNAGLDLALRKWYYLPEIVGPAHLPLLHTFQQFIELSEAAQIFSSLAQTNAGNLDVRTAELKIILTSWRERLPNESDDINVWSDLVAWRTHTFSAINNTYLPLLPEIQRAAQNGGNGSYAYRGYHETAWIINRFAHVARKHNLTEVCIQSLNKIYTLPNIEIQEAFLKLREQAKCHYQYPGELTTGLDVISNTNLAYFSNPQKAEFFTLKGMFLAKLGCHEEATQVFNSAVHMDANFPKAWAEWGEYHNRVFKENPNDYVSGANAVSCYLQAAGLYKNGKVRKYLLRILWLLSLDDSQKTIAKAFEGYKGEIPVWYWITFIPQLLLSLSHREAQHARTVLVKIARSHPQALFYQLRTCREEMAGVRKQYLQARAANAREGSEGRATSPTKDGDTEMAPPPLTASVNSNGQSVNGNPPRPQHPWEYVEEVNSVLKTAYPLLALTLETIGDQIQQRFKASNDEDVYRITVALLNDALGQYVVRGLDHTDPGTLQPITVTNVRRFAEGLSNSALKDSFTADFVDQVPNLQQYIQRLTRWRDRYEVILDRKQRKQNLESCSHWLVEFQYHRFDEIEVPGQYIKLDDNTQSFVRISHFQSKYDFFRQANGMTRRLSIVGHDGSLHHFAVQHPAARHSRREERIMQFFRLLNEPLQHKREARKRMLQFRLPVVVPLAPQVRLFESDPAQVSLQEIFDKHCKEASVGKDDAALAFIEGIRSLSELRNGLTGQDLDLAKLEVFSEVATKIFPDDILTKYMTRAMAGPTDLWLCRKQMTLDYASFIFMTYIFCLGQRTPQRIHVSRATGCLHTTDVITVLSNTMPEFTNTEPVPFRFTPNVQSFLTAIGTEGILSSAILAIASAVLDTEDDLEQRLGIFVREEMNAWHGYHHKTPPDGAIRDLTVQNVGVIVKRAKLLSCQVEREKQPVGGVPANQTILELIAQATNPIKLSQMDILSLPWL